MYDKRYRMINCGKMRRLRTVSHWSMVSQKGSILNLSHQLLPSFLVEVLAEMLVLAILGRTLDALGGDGVDRRRLALHIFFFGWVHNDETGGTGDVVGLMGRSGELNICFPGFQWTRRRCQPS